LNIERIIHNELITSVKNITGATLTLSSPSSAEVLTMKDIKGACFVYLDVKHEDSFTVVLSIPAKLATVISSLMLDTKATSEDKIDKDDLGALKSFFNTFTKSIESSLKANSVQAEITLDKVAIEDAVNVVKSFQNIIRFYAEFENVLVDEKYMYLLSKTNLDSISIKSEQENSARSSNLSLDKLDFSQEELSNLNLILDVQIEVKVRIGSKKMFLKDAINMDIGSVVELDRLLNEPLDILVDNKIIGHGEVVIVDGNFGIRVTGIVDSVTRLESLRNQ